jgi:hypothetical protein
MRPHLIRRPARDIILPFHRLVILAQISAGTEHAVLVEVLGILECCKLAYVAQGSRSHVSADRLTNSFDTYRRWHRAQA